MPLSRSARKKLGKTLIQHADRTVREMIVERGGNASNVRQAGHWADETLAAAADAAVEGDQQAASAIKIVKNARKLGEEH